MADFYTIKEVAEKLGVSKQTVLRLRARGELRTVIIGKRCVRVPVSQYEALRRRFNNGC